MLLAELLYEMFVTFTLLSAQLEVAMHSSNVET